MVASSKSGCMKCRYVVIVCINIVCDSYLSFRIHTSEDIIHPEN